MVQTYPEQLRLVVAALQPEVDYSGNASFRSSIDTLIETAMQFRDAYRGLGSDKLGRPSYPYCYDDGSPTPRALTAPYARGAGLAAFNFSAGVQEIRKLSGYPDIGALLNRATGARGSFEDARAEVISILSAFLAFSGDSHVEELRTRIRDLAVPAEKEIRVTNFRAGEQRPPIFSPHEAIDTEARAVELVFAMCSELAKWTGHAANHIERLSRRPAAGVDRQLGTRVFIGHGRSPLWRELKDFIAQRLGLPYDEFNRVPVAGTTTVDRLSQMLDNAAVALLVLTAEDERTDRSVVARQNVVHEAGLFQGRLGFSRAIIMIEEGCEPFSNIDGLGQIYFPTGTISATFESVRQILEREQLITGSDTDGA